MFSSVHFHHFFLTASKAIISAQESSERLLHTDINSSKLCHIKTNNRFWCLSRENQDVSQWTMQQYSTKKAFPILFTIFLGLDAHKLFIKGISCRDSFHYSCMKLLSSAVHCIMFRSSHILQRLFKEKRPHSFFPGSRKGTSVTVPSLLHSPRNMLATATSRCSPQLRPSWGAVGRELRWAHLENFTFYFQEIQNL